MRLGKSFAVALTAAIYLACAGTAFATGNPEVNPPGSVEFFGGGVCFETATSGTSEACQNEAIEHLNEERTSLGQGTYKLPKDFDKLSPEKQMFILSNSDRVSYGEAPYIGLSPYLNTASKEGVEKDEDPNVVPHLPPETPWRGAAANWAGAFANAELAYYAWMYDDGPGSANEDCKTEGEPGCWGHRQDTLAFNGASGAVVMGDAAGLDNEGHQGYAEGFLLAENSSWTTFTYTWAEALEDINGSVPTITGVSPASGPAAGGNTVTIKGTKFTGATKVTFGSFAATSFKVVSETEITAVAPAEAPALHNLTVTTAAGTSAPVVADQYTFTA